MKKLADDLQTDSILIIAAEASSCMYAKNFIKKWREHSPDTQFFGVGDKEMQRQGMDCQGLAENLAVVGLQEVINHWSEIKETFQNIEKQAGLRRPRFALLFDYPGFNLRLARRLKNIDVPVVYYISPQLWAWKKGRVTQVQKYVDDMLVVFPFELDFYKPYDVNAHFVGHPLVEIVDEELEKLGGSTGEGPVLGLMPGSRKSEIRHNLKVQLQTAQKLRQSHQVRVKLLVAPTLEIEFVQQGLGDLLDGVELVQAKPTAMIQQCDLILSASGTATLQVALCEKPMVVMYRMNGVTAFFAKILVRSVDAFCIVNLIAKQKVVPEYFQERANPEQLAKSLARILDDKDYRQNMLLALQSVKTGLGKGGATENVVNYLKEKYS